MSDFITLKCPSCGAALKISPGTPTQICTYCGTEHIVRHEGGAVLLESYARCPRCGRNDQVVKVSGLVQANISLSQGTTYEPKTYRDRDGKYHTTSERVPFGNTQASLLALKLAMPPGPIEPTQSKESWSSKSTISVAVGIIVCYGFAQLGLPAIGVPALIISFVAAIIISYRKNKKVKEHKDSKFLERMLLFEQITTRWENAHKRWEQLYYCQRDDSVFLPVIGTSAPSDQMVRYIDTDGV